MIMSEEWWTHVESLACPLQKGVTIVAPDISGVDDRQVEKLAESITVLVVIGLINVDLNKPGTPGVQRCRQGTYRW